LDEVVREADPLGNGVGHSEDLYFHTVTNQKAAQRLIRAEPPGLILVETDGKPRSRVKFCETLRSRLPRAAVIAVSAAPPADSFVYDGFIQLPLDVAQASANLAQLLRGYSGDRLILGPIQLNITTRTVRTPTGQHHMTPKQCALLQMLMQHNTLVVKRSEIMQMIWETSYLADTRTLDVHIRWLRERIEPDPSNPIYLTTVRGVGYQLSLPVNR
jgi:DNA-binding response OmpR family regulator